MLTGGRDKEEKPQAAAVNRAKVEKTPKIITAKQAQPVLFNYKPILLYIDSVQSAQELLSKDEMGVARANLLQLIKTYPQYPEAYVLLGDSYRKTKHTELAVQYYKIALGIAPFDVDTLVKHAMQEQLSIASDKVPELTAQLAQARKVKETEKSFRIWYHSKLRYQFLDLEMTDTCDVTESDVDYQNIHLSWTAVRDAFWGFQAWELQNYELAEYYFACAVTKFNDDFISWGCLTYLVFADEDIKSNELTALNQITDTYPCALVYFTCFLYSYYIDEDECAYEDLKKFFSDVDKFEYFFLDSHKDMVLEFLLDKAQAEKLDSEQAEAAKKEVTRVAQELSTNKYKGEIDSKIQLLNSLIYRNKDQHALYSTLGTFYDYKNELAEAILNFSVAIWLCPAEYLSLYYFDRAKCLLRLGETFSADHDFERVLHSLEAMEKQKRPKDIPKTLHDFAEFCLKVGKQFLKEDNFKVADAVLSIGVVRKWQVLNDYTASFENIDKRDEDCYVLKNLYIACVEAKERKGESDQSLIDYVFKALTDIGAWNPGTLVLLKEKGKIALKLREKFSLYEKRLNRAVKKSQSAPPIPREKIKPASVISKKNYRRLTFFNTTTPRVKCLNPAINNTNPQPNFSELFEGIVVGSEKSEHKKTEEEIKREKGLIDEARKQRIREKKHVRLQSRKQNRIYQYDLSSSGSEAEDSENKNEVTVPATIAEITNIKKVDLTDFEKKIFTMLIELVPEELRKNYKIYLGGGWAYDKIRKVMLGIPECKYNDFDLRTNIPAEYLEKLFKPIAEVKGLFGLMVDKIKIDVVYEPEIDNLARIAKKCDFLSLFIDSEGGVHDLNGFGLIYMQRQQLYSSVPPAEIFKDDPLRIFRAIYTATKRQCRFTTIKKQIRLDSCLLIPYESSESSIDNLLNPHRFNIWIAKLFSQGMAITNFALLQKHKFNLLEVLFPSIYHEMLFDMDWIENQMVITNSYPFPKIAIVYATFIASAIAHRIPIFHIDHELVKSDSLIYAATDIYESSLLFKDAYPSVDELLGYLKRPFLDWKVQHELPVSYTAQMEAPAPTPTIMRLG
jgi:tetratricopeptide (TPR) repeat protein